MYPQSQPYTPSHRRKSGRLLTSLFLALMTTLAIASVGVPCLALAESAEPAVIVGTAAEEVSSAPADSSDSDKSALAAAATEQSAVVDGTPKQQAEQAFPSTEAFETESDDESAINPIADPTVDPAADPATDPVVDPATDSTSDPAVNPTVDPAADPTKLTTDAPAVTPGTEQNSASSQNATTEENSTGEKTDAKTAAAEAEKNADDPAAAEVAGTKIAESIAAQLKPVVKKLAAKTSTTSTDPFVIVIDAGHGGFDVGAVGNGLEEHALNLSIAKHIQELLQGFANVVVYMTRTTNTSFTSVTKTDLLARVNFAVQHHADVFISVHTNSGPSAAHGIEVIAQNDSSYRYALHTESMGLANAVFNAERAIGLASHSGVYTRDYGSGAEGKYPDGSNADYLSLLRNCRKNNIPAILIENLFISNPGDAAYLRSDANRKKIAQAIVNGIANYYHLNNLVADSTGLRYLNDDKKTYATNAFKTVGKKTYYFGGDTYAVKADQTIGGKLYYFDTDSCVMQTGWHKWDDGSWSYFDSNGPAATGWRLVSKKWYYLDPTTLRALTDCERAIKGKTYGFNSSCAMVTGWRKWSDGWTYADKDGAEHAGWLLDKKKWYYLDPTTLRAVENSEKKIGSKTYGFNTSCAMVTGWHKWADGSWTWADSNGAEKAGWLLLKKKWYYLDPTTLRAAVSEEREIKGKKYLFNSSCAMRTGWYQWPDGSWTWSASDGAERSGWQYINKKWYYFDLDTLRAVSDCEKEIKGKTYLFNSSCAMVTGWHKWDDGSWSWYGSDGAKRSGWQYIKNKWYYIDPDTLHALTSCTREIKGYTYRFNDSCAMVTGWYRWDDGSWSYYNSDKKSSTYGAMLTGDQTIDGIPFALGTSGRYYPQRIMGSTQTSVAQMARYYNATVGASKYPAIYKSKGASTISDFCRILFEEANAEGVRAEMLFAQVMLETGHLQFGGDVLPKQCNFGGIGATGNGVPGYSFKDVRTGLRVQTQHLKAYASTEPLNNACVDPRFSLVKRGSATTVYDLAGKWASDPRYGYSLTSIMNGILTA